MPTCKICNDIDLKPLWPEDIVAPLIDVEEAANNGCTSCSMIANATRTLIPLWNNIDETNVEVRVAPKRYAPLNIALKNLNAPPAERMMSVAEICVHTIESDPGAWPKTNIARLMPTRSNAEECIDLIKTWIDTCNNEHDLCRPSEQTLLPARVVDVLAPGSDFVRLHATNSKETGRYIALSHCWGKVQIIRTLGSNVEQHKQQIPLLTLSNTFRDAVQLCRTLSVRYLWIDSLCIIQDDKHDWEVESSKMASIYQDAYLVIAATRSSDGNGGLFSDRAISHPISTPSATGERYTAVARRAVDHTEFTTSASEHVGLPNTSPLLLRAWCFQEGLLGSRILHFTEQELLFDCKGGTRCERGWLKGYSGEKSNYDQMMGGTEDAFPPRNAWLYIVQDYMSRSLTKDEDRLPALSGVASRMEGKVGGRYLAGLWESDLPRTLFWTPSAKPHWVEDRWNYRPKQYTAPSWSWASVKGSIAFKGMDEEHPNIVLTVHDARCDVDGENRYGRLQSGFVKLRSAVVEARYEGLEKNKKGWTPTGLIRRDRAEESFTIDTFEDSKIALGTLIMCVEHSTWEKPIYDGGRRRKESDTLVRALVLVPVEGRNGSCRRIGVMEWCKPSWFEGADIRTITVI